MTTSRASGWIDISVPIANGMVHWPGDPPFRINRAHDQQKGDEATVSEMTLGVHTGTHMDAPLHYIQGATSIDQMPLDAALGPARVVAIKDDKSIGPDELQAHNIQTGERILFKTKNSEKSWKTPKFDEDFVFISREGAQHLVERGVRCVGVDYLSVGGFRIDGAETHHTLLGNGIWIIEGLNLHDIEPGDYELVCLPLKLVGAEGAPARALLRRAA